MLRIAKSRDVLGGEQEAPPAPRLVRVTVKTPQQMELFVVPVDRGVKEFKEEVAARFSSPPDRLVLIFIGRILKDHKTLREHGIHEDATVYLVILSRGRCRDQPGHDAVSSWHVPAVLAAQSNPPSRPSSVGSTAAGTDSLQHLIRALGLRTANFADFQSQLRAHPEMMLRLLQDPFIQSRLSQPDLMVELVTDGALKEEVTRGIPALARFPNTPELLRLALELARRPAAVWEIMQSPSSAVSYVASILSREKAEPSICSEDRGAAWEAAPQRVAPVGSQASLASPRSQLSAEIRHLFSQQTAVATKPLQPLQGNGGVPGSHQDGSCRSLGGDVSSSTGQRCSIPDLGPPSAAAKSLLQQLVELLMKHLLSGPCTRGTRQMLPPDLERKGLQKASGEPHVREQPLSAAFLQQTCNLERPRAVPDGKDVQMLARIEQSLQMLADACRSPAVGESSRGGAEERWGSSQ